MAKNIRSGAKKIANSLEGIDTVDILGSRGSNRESISHKCRDK